MPQAKNDLFKDDTGDGTRGAVISECGKFRYMLYRLLREDTYIQRRTCVFVMLNPSTADGIEDDPTIRRCMRFAAAWDYTMLEVINLFAYRATKPKDLFKSAISRMGPSYNYHTNKSISGADLIICGWGKLPKAYMEFSDAMVDRIRLLQKTPMCLKVNKDGSPAHPLYLKADLKPIMYSR